jgi:transcriptional regulator with XRE-family HTH domain
MKFSDQVRQAIRECGFTRYRIAKDTGVSESALSRFMAGKGNLNLDTLDRLAGVLGLTLRARNAKKGKRS